MSSPAYGNPRSKVAAWDALAELALDLRWSFNHAADKLWERLDPELWELTRNPWIMLQTVSHQRLQSVTAEQDFQSLLADLHRERRAAEQPQGWFQKAHPRSALKQVAYFSMEFMRESMARLTPVFSTNRVVRQYTEEHYLSAAAAFAQRAANGGSLGADLVNWRAELSRHWPKLRFGSATVEQQGQEYLFQVQAFLDDLDPEAVAVELYAEARQGQVSVRQLLHRAERLVGSANGFLYTARVPAARPAADFTPRLVPRHDGSVVPLEAPFILWHDSPSWRQA